ncbi:MAG: hypothetical protein ACJ8FS_16630 [Sphingomicrobium sp.]
MLLIYGAVLFGIFRFRSLEYWKLVGFLFAWMLGAQLLFAGGGTLQNPSGDGLIAHQIRVATNDGPGMGIFAIVFIIVYWGGAIWLLRRMWSVGKEGEEERLDREAEMGEEVSGGRKLAEALGATVIAAIYIYFVFILPRTTTEAAPPIVTSTNGSEQTDPIADQLAQAAREATPTHPKRIDPITTLESVTADGRELTYHYRLSRRDASDDALRQFVRKHGVTLACKNTGMLAAMKDYQVTYHYSYMLPNAAKLVVVDATYDECKGLGLTG